MFPDRMAVEKGASVLKKLTPVLIVLSFVLCLAPVSCDRFVGEKEEAVEVISPEEMKLERSLAEPEAGGVDLTYMARQKKPELQEPLSALDMEVEEKAPVPMPEERKRVYSGFARIRVDSVEKRKNELFDIAETSGGYVESVHENTVVIRVPAEQFEEIFQMILGFGEVLEKREETYDVTEYFHDLETRIIILKRTRTRLYALLEKTSDVEERVKILREISRLTEQIEIIEGNLRLIEEQIAFSRITLELVSRLPHEEQQRERIPFSWIAELDPLYVSIPDLKGSVELDLGENFAVFTKDDAFRAESPGGIRVRVGTTQNSPEGNNDFWQGALSYHLAPYYRSAEKVEAGKISAVFFTSKDAKPFFYLVGVHVEKKRIYVVEAFFPDEEAMKDNREIVLDALEGMKIQ
jgi:hypothetical protein